jgi:hypothetical protein
MQIRDQGLRNLAQETLDQSRWSRLLVFDSSLEHSKTSALSLMTGNSATIFLPTQQSCGQFFKDRTQDCLPEVSFWGLELRLEQHEP